MMSKKIKKRRTPILLIIAFLMLLRYVIFAPQIDRFFKVTQGMKDRKAQYQLDNPGATSAEVEEAFSKSLNRLSDWEDNYKKEHPDATDADINKAFENWSGSRAM